MLKKLKIKFVVITMALLFAVLAAIITGICVSTQRKLDADGMQSLRKAVQQDKFSVEIGKPGKPSMYGVFNVEIRPDGSMAVFSGSASVDEDAIRGAVGAVLAAGAESGKTAGFAYVMKPTAAGSTKISFRDLASDRAVMSNLLRTLLLVGALALAVFFAISLFLAKRAIRPVEESWERQRQFVADASHELKNPLAVIRANCAMVMGRPGETVGSQEKWLGYIEREAERLSGLAEDLLFLARTDAAAGPADFGRVDLSDVLWGCVLPFEPVAFERGRTLVSDISADIFVRGDAGRLRRMAMALIDNACKHSSDGSAIEVKLGREDGAARLSVKNTGRPIAPEQQARIFERFYRPDGSRSRDGGGAGLGLAIASAVAEEHGGKISVSSSAEDGTVFSVTLPAA